MTEAAACLYFGEVMHRRVRPVAHEFRYRVATLCVDLDEIDALSRRLRLFSRNRFNLFGFDDRDHGDGGDLRAWAERQLAAAGIAARGGRIRVLCFPRLLGYVFNPLTLYFCHEPGGALRAVIYEVHNTFGERHAYALPVSGEGVAPHAIVQRAEKGFYVSPFVPMAAEYRFRLRPPGERFALAIREHDAAGDILHATLHGRRVPLSDAALLRACLAYPALTMKVIGAIHWQALRLWLKGVPFHARRGRARPQP
jgi:hypothetical protein